MASQVQYGSKGSDVKKLQQTLNRSGYKLAEDGIFGAKTQAAVKDYQKKNKLAVDGIVGTQTWNTLVHNLNESRDTKTLVHNLNESRDTKTLVHNPNEGTSRTNYSLLSTGSGNSATSTSAPTIAPAPGKPTFNTTPTAAPTIDPLPTAPTYDTTKWDDTEKGQNAGKAKEDAKEAVNSYGEFTYDPYQESEVTAAAKAAIEAQMAKKPGAYQSQWQQQLDEAINKILNREKFSYDLNGDALYQQYKDKYIQQGKMAMADTMGQAAAMTGGYGNSYAASVGNQAYQQSLQQLNDIVPELYQMAYDRYQNEGQDLYNQYGIISDRENMDYGRYRDTVSDWRADLDYVTGRYDSERAFDYGKYVDDRNLDHTLHQEGYNRLLDAYDMANSDYYDGANLFHTEQSNENSVAGQTFNDAMAIWNANTEQKWNEAEWTEDQRRYDNDLEQRGYDNEYREWHDGVDNQWKEATWNRDQTWRDEDIEHRDEREAIEDKRYDKEYEAKYGAPVLEEGSEEYWEHTNSKYESGNWNNGTLSQDQIKQIQRAAGVTADGLFGPDTIKATGCQTAEEAYKKYFGGGGTPEPKPESADDYADWDATDWEGYFATIRNTKGKSAAQEELDRMVKAGLIPQKMLIYAGIGARGSLGH
jgi:peptidoglycan hydrolase-like protein with peptidoglycan-binding domain